MKIRDYYNAFDLRYDLREARKFLNIDRATYDTPQDSGADC